MAMRSGLGSGSDMTYSEALSREGGRELNRESRRTFGYGNRPPTLTAQSGDVFLVQVTQNLTFDGPYQNEMEEGNE